MLEHHAGSAERPDPATDRRKVVLIVDDEAPIRTLMSRILTARGFDVHDVADGRRALEYDGVVDVVVTDLVMPEQEGLETIRLLHQARPGVAIVAMSGAFGGAFLHTARLLGASAVLRKPFDPETLVATIQGVVSE
jgi:CheY-like chemotaxis protein